MAARRHRRPWCLRSGPRGIRYAAPAIVVLIGLLASPPSALGVRSGGHNPPTRKLEAAFKVLGGWRAQSDDGCYPGVRRAAKLIEHWSDPESDVAHGLDAVRRPNVVYVIRGRARCDRVLMALRARGRLYLLDTAHGEVYVHGERRSRRGGENPRGGRGPLRALTLVTRSFWIDRPDRARRLVVRCPKGRFPLGGGMVSAPTFDPDGEGVYPHSYERLGVQRGYHVTALIIDPSQGATTGRWATIQVVCGRGLVPTSSPHRTVFVHRNGTNTAVARCPRGQYLFSGGFQRTNFTTPSIEYGGNYATESRATDPRTWQVTGHAAGWDGGELTAIAYCVKSGGPLLTEVSASAALAAGATATATTPPCPSGHALTAGGFSFHGSRHAFFGDGSINLDGSWSATGFGYFGPVEAITAYGYCLEGPGL